MRRNPNAFVSLMMVFLVFSSCTMKAKDQITLFLDIAPTKHKASARVLPSIDQVQEVIGIPGVLGFPNPTPSPSAPTASTDLSGFDCFAINVMGPGIPSQEVPKPGDPPADVVFSRVMQGVPTAYQGIISSKISYTPGPQSIELDVPAGPARMVQLIGLKSAAANDPIAQFCNGVTGFVPDGEGFFEVGRSFIPNAFSDVGVTLNEDYVGKPAWYQEYKRLSQQNGCKPFATRYGVGNIQSAAGKAFSIAVNPSISMAFNDIQVEVTTTVASETLTASLYTDVNTAPSTSMFPGVGTYATAVAATNTVSFASTVTNQQVGFHFPPTTIPGGANPSFIIIYSTLAQNFQLTGESTGVPSPISSESIYAASWSALSTSPHVMIGRCF